MLAAFGDKFGLPRPMGSCRRHQGKVLMQTLGYRVYYPRMLQEHIKPRGHSTGYQASPAHPFVLLFSPQLYTTTRTHKLHHLSQCATAAS